MEKPWSDGDTVRRPEVYCCDLEIGRPQKLPHDAASTSDNSHVMHSSDLYFSASDGSQFPASRWHEHHWPQILQTVTRLWRDCFCLVDEPGMSPSLSEQKAFQSHFKGKGPVPGQLDSSCGRWMLSGLDFIANEDDQMTLIEINSRCNTTHTPSSALDTSNKTKVLAICLL